MKSKTVAGLAIAAAVVIAGLLYASPYLALRSIGKAIDAKDADTVAEYVDFPALRESVKGQLLIKMQAELQKPEMKDNPFAGLGQMLAASMVNQVVDTLVSPAGVMLMLENGKPGKPADVAAAGVGVETKVSQRKNMAVNYQGWSKVFVHPKDQPGGFVFRRDGLMGWKLVAIKMD